MSHGKCTYPRGAFTDPLLRMLRNPGRVRPSRHRKLRRLRRHAHAGCSAACRHRAGTGATRKCRLRCRLPAHQCPTLTPEAWPSYSCPGCSTPNPPYLLKWSMKVISPIRSAQGGTPRPSGEALSASSASGGSPKCTGALSGPLSREAFSCNRCVITFSARGAIMQQVS